MTRKRGTRPTSTRICSRFGVFLVTAVATATAWGIPSGATPVAGKDPATTSTADNLASLVDPFVGTGSGPITQGEVGTFPGADVPFGMMQWSPDTAPDRVQGGGYDYADTSISGFSLTHLSGAGCSVFGDVPILPTTGALPQHPGNATESFSHGNESASPGRYQVSLGDAGNERPTIGHDPNGHRTDYVSVDELGQPPLQGQWQRQRAP